MKCKNCKYFSQPGLDDIQGSCNCPKFIYSGEWGTKEDQDDALYYCDYEGYSASFNVGINFGCVHYERKNK